MTQNYKTKILKHVGGPPSDISDRSANSDKVGAGDKGAVAKKESTGELLFIADIFTEWHKT